MKEIITIRIEELVQEINNLLAHHEKLAAEINRTQNEIAAKKGAIYELKGIIESDNNNL